MVCCAFIQLSLLLVSHTNLIDSCCVPLLAFISIAVIVFHYYVHHLPHTQFVMHSHQFFSKKPLLHYMCCPFTPCSCENHHCIFRCLSTCWCFLLVMISHWLVPHQTLLHFVIFCLFVLVVVWWLSSLCNLFHLLPQNQSEPSFMSSLFTFQ